MSANQELNKRRQQLNIWLAEKNLSRKALADMLNIAESTVYGWLSCTNISDKRWKEIKAIFTPEEPQPKQEQLRAVALALTDEEYSTLAKMAEEMNMPIDLFIRQSMLELRKNKLNGE